MCLSLKDRSKTNKMKIETKESCFSPLFCFFYERSLLWTRIIKKVGNSEISDMLDVIRRNVDFSELDDNHRYYKLRSELEDIMKESRFQSYKDFRYDVLTILTNCFNSDELTPGSLFYKILSVIQTPEVYDPNRG